MKKKIFSALLMGVFTLASMSMFVSCKDYDDDINGLDTQQQELLSRLEALEGNVDTNLSTLKDQLATATENANKALTGVQGLEGTVSEVASTAQAAGNAAATAQTTAEGAQDAADKAQATADEALETAKKALEAAGADESGKTAIEQVAALAERVGKLEALAESIPTLIQQVQQATQEELATLKAKVDKYEAYFDNLFAMVTSVELYGTFNGNGMSVKELPFPLTMLHGNVKGNSVFGDDEAYVAANPQITFTDKADIKAKAGVLVRVNPVNAKIDGDNCAIKVINSKGVDMSDYIKVADVEPYDELITRAGKINSGLYKVNFEFVDGVDMKAFETATKDPESGKDILYAVAINNTDTLQADRYVASTFDLTLNDEAYTPKYDVLDFNVTGTNGKMNVSAIRNRWDGSAATDDNQGEGTEAIEYKWNPEPAQGVTVPASAMTKDKNSVSAGSDDARSASTFKFVPVSVNVPFTVSLGEGSEKIAYYYVVLDKDFAGESQPSEWNAWNGYSYTGLQQVVAADEKLNITINSESANGDKIGFRVFAVNLDGTLVDPDGRAFYVAVGNDASVEDVNAEIKVWVDGTKNNSTIVALPSTFKPQATTDARSNTIARSVFDKDGIKSVSGAAINYIICKDAKGTPAANWSEAKYIYIAFNDAKNFLNDATFSFTIEAKANDATTDRIVNTLNVNVKKVMPTAADKEFSFKAGQLVNDVYTCYLDPNNLVSGTTEFDWTKAATAGIKDLWNFVTGMDDQYFTWTFADAQWNASKKADEDYVVNSKKDGVLDIAIANDYIDNKTQHATTIVYNFQDISCVLDKDGVPTNTNAAYPVAVEECNTVFACPLDPSVLTYGWNQKNIGTTAKPNMVDVNAIMYSQTTPQNLDDKDKLTDYISAKSAVDGAIFTSNGVWKDGLYCSVTATLTSNDTKKVDYYNVSYENGDFVFTEVLSGRTNPTTDVASTLTISAKDAFGHSKVIAELPFTVLRRP